MANTGRWQAVDPEPIASRPEPQPEPRSEPTPAVADVAAPVVAEVAPPAVVDLVAAERTDRPRAEATPGTVEIEAVLTEDEYQRLLAGAAEAGKTPNDFVRQAVRDACFFGRNTPPGSKILIVSGGKVHTVR